MTCLSPIQCEGKCRSRGSESSFKVNFTLSLNGEFYSFHPIPTEKYAQRNSSAWIFYDPPVISSHHPIYGDTTGGTEVTVKGYGFGRMENNSGFEGRCNWENQGVTVMKFLNDTTVVCPSPSAWTTDNVAVPSQLKIAINGQQFDAVSNNFTWIGEFRSGDLYFAEGLGFATCV